MLIFHHQLKILFLLVSLGFTALVYGKTISVARQLSKQEQLEYQIDPDQLIYQLISFVTNDPIAIEEAVNYLDKHWEAEMIPMVLDLIHISRNKSVEKKLFKLLQQKTGQSFANDLHVWQDWVWNKEALIYPFHADFMAELYKHLDPKFERYFYDRTDQSLIRLDEVRWGGVVQDGIPPLRNPKMLKAREADYLDDSNIVFGVEVNGDVRAYPKRILAWHEMFVDKVGGIPVAGVYCTLCGTVILYDTKVNGVNHELGTSGFLYRSNKMMYDKATQSLWNTIEGKPIVGALVSKGIELPSRSVVTTTWGEWRKRHPETKVLSLETGHRRNYNEGEAYRTYFATDDLMFKVPQIDRRLKNKAEVLIIRAEGYKTDPLAIAAKFLRKNNIYQDQISDQAFVVVTDKTGGNRVYQTNQQKFAKIKNRKTLIDNQGGEWTIEEEQLIGPNGEELKRLPYHRIFWFAWYNTYPATRLVK